MLSYCESPHWGIGLQLKTENVPSTRPASIFQLWEAESSSLSQFPLLSSQDVSNLFDPFFPAKERDSRLASIRYHVVKHQRSLLRPLFYDSRPFSIRDETFWNQLMDAENFYQEQIVQLFGTEEEELKQGPAYLLRSLFMLRCTHVLYAWTGFKETTKRDENNEGFTNQFFEVVSCWTDHAIALTVSFYDSMMVVEKS